MRWHAPPPPRILSEHLASPPEPLALLVRAGEEAPPPAVARIAARALLDLPEVARGTWPAWLAPHQVSAAVRLSAMLTRYGGALLADAVGLGKSYIALAVALAHPAPFVLIVPAVLVGQWRTLLRRFDAAATIITHETLSGATFHPSALPSFRLAVVDEAHRFRNPDTNRYRALAKLVVGARVLLVTATPVYNRIADLFHLFRLFLRDHALTSLGVSSLARAARGEVSTETLAMVAARLMIARSRERVRSGYPDGPVALTFPERRPGLTVRAGTTTDRSLESIVGGVRRLVSGVEAGALFRVTLLRRLASSLPAFRASLARYAAFLDLAAQAAREHRALSPREFQRLFPRREPDDLQLVLFPVVLEAADACSAVRDVVQVEHLRQLAASATNDAKADALERLLAERTGKTIVFTEARATVRYLVRRLNDRRVAAILSEGGLFGAEPAGRAEVLRAFAPAAQGAAPPAAAVETDVLIATDLLSEGLNLQDADRVIHYDLPWSPARLAQRVGRIDRLGSRHSRIETVTFVPPDALERALELEERLAVKTRIQLAVGTPEVETVRGADARSPAFDWCDRLDALLANRAPEAPPGACASIAGEEDAAVLVVRIGGMVEAVIVTADQVRADPDAATCYFEQTCRAERRTLDGGALERAIRRAAPLLRDRLGTVQDARWRGGNRDRLSRRLIPWVLTAARRAARRGDGAQLAALDALVSRLASGMTTGEELLLEDLVARRSPLHIRHLLAWHERLPAVEDALDAPQVELVAALVVAAEAPSAAVQAAPPRT